MARFECSGRQGRLMRELINLFVLWSWSVGERDAALRHRISHGAMRQCPTRGTTSSTWGQARRARSSAHRLRVSSVGGLLGSQVPRSRGRSPWGRIWQTHRPFAPGPCSAEFQIRTHSLTHTHTPARTRRPSSSSLRLCLRGLPLPPVLLTPRSQLPPCFPSPLPRRSHSAPARRGSLACREPCPALPYHPAPS